MESHTKIIIFFVWVDCRHDKIFDGWVESRSLLFLFFGLDSQTKGEKSQGGREGRRRHKSPRHILIPTIGRRSKDKAHQIQLWPWVYVLPVVKETSGDDDDERYEALI